MAVKSTHSKSADLLGVMFCKNYGVTSVLMETIVFIIIVNIIDAISFSEG